MKQFLSSITLLLLFTLSISTQSTAQESLPFDLQYEVKRIYPPVSITKEKLSAVSEIIDINPYFKSDWVKEYKSVEIKTSHKGVIKTAIAADDQLTVEQKNNIGAADIGSDIFVIVKYLPDNNLTKNDIQEIKFDFTIDPIKDASYTAGVSSLNQYLKENAIDMIPASVFKQYNLTAIKFAIDETGNIIDVHTFESSRDEKTDALLKEVIGNMKSWEPAEYADGTKVKQEFVLTVGDMTSCINNLLNTRTRFY